MILEYEASAVSFCLNFRHYWYNTFEWMMNSLISHTKQRDFLIGAILVVLPYRPCPGGNSVIGEKQFLCYTYNDL
ncbi:hypothetical protein Pelo_4530 [Pelomyxa schiedti]|nr:hypothetical protein Pelo_4530 [Pelomyxa schiedti]